MNNNQYHQARATILKSIFVDHLNYDQVSQLIKDKYNLNYEDVAYRMDEEGVF